MFQLPHDGLDGALIYAVEDVLTFRRIAPETVLFREGEIGTTLYIILNGKVKIYNMSDKSEEKTVAIFKNGQSFGELALIDGETRSASAKTLTYCELLTLSGFAFHKLMQDNYAMVEAVLKELSSRIRKTNKHVHDLVFLDAKTQVVKTLINLANEHGKRVRSHIIELDLRLNKQDLANMCGISLEIVDFVLIDLMKREFLAVENGKYQLNLLKNS